MMDMRPERIRPGDMRVDAVLRIERHGLDLRCAIIGAASHVKAALEAVCREQGCTMDELLDPICVYLFRTQGEGDYMMDIDDLRRMAPHA